jgi:hypothetical protein
MYSIEFSKMARKAYIKLPKPAREQIYIKIYSPRLAAGLCAWGFQRGASVSSLLVAVRAGFPHRRNIFR